MAAMTPIHGPKKPEDVLAPMRKASKASITSESKVDEVAGQFFIPQAPGPMPESRMVEKVKSDIKKTKEFIASGGKVDTFTEQIAQKAVEIASKSRESLPVAMNEPEKEKKAEVIKSESTTITRPSRKERVWSKVSHPQVAHKTSDTKSASVDGKSPKQKEVKQFEETIEKEVHEKATKYRHKVIQDDIDRHKGRTG